MPLSPGQILHNRYRIVKLLGQGGFGAVYRAWDMNLNGAVAVKENFDASLASQSQFAVEASILFKLRHPNLPVVIDHFTLPGQGQYLVMDYIEGEDLEELRISRGGRLDEAQVLPWIGQVLEALAYMHAQQPAVIHRDIKPANIKITSTNDPTQPGGKAMLVDFGVAKVFDPSQRTLTGARAVTPGFAPIEQYGQAPTDARSDIYAVGATLYTVLTGEVPIDSLDRMAGTALPAPRILNPYVTVDIENAILTALQVQPQQRFQSAAQMKRALLPPPAPQVAQPATQPVPQTLVQAQPVATWPVNQAVQAQGRPQSSVAAPISRPRQSVSRWLIGIVLLLLVGVIYLGSQQIARKVNDQNATRTVLAYAEAEAISTQSAETVKARLTQKAVFTATPSSKNPTDQVQELTATYIIGAATNTRLPIVLPSTATPIPPTAAPALGIGSTLVSTKDQMVLLYIPAGEFMMGVLSSDTQANGDEKPRHKVLIDAFWMYQSEVTNAMYDLCVKVNICQPPQFVKSHSRTHYYDDAQFSSYPVIYVSWTDANTYCRWAGGRLSTEAEWEKAARGELEGKLYPRGDEAPVCDKQAKNGANFGSCSQGDTTPAGDFLPNGYGLYDMTGNVWEWVADWYGDKYYTTIPVDAWPANPTGPITGDYRVLRGGAWNDNPNFLRVSERLRYTPDVRNGNSGFRCVHSP